MQRKGKLEFAARDIRWNKLYRTTVEVIDSMVHRVVARFTIDRYVTAVLSDGRAVAYALDDDGIARVDVLTFEMNRPQ